MAVGFEIEMSLVAFVYCDAGRYADGRGSICFIDVHSVPHGRMHPMPRVGVGEASYLLVRLRLQVAAADGVEGFPTEIVVALSRVRVAQIVPGATVKVRVDPLSREVVLDQPRT